MSLDPMTSEFFTLDILSNVFETLVRHDPLMAIEPGLAVEWSLLDEQTWSFRLRDGVRFHDGTELSAEVAKQAFDRVLKEVEAPGKQYLATVDSVQAVDRLRLLVRTRTPDSLLLQRLAQVRIPLGATTEEVVERGIGTGPYRLAEWRKGDRVVLLANPDYWAGPPSQGRVEFVQVPREERLEALMQGEIDLMALTTPIEAPLGADIEIVRGPSLTRMFLWFSSEDGPTRDPRVRRAVALALDRPALAEQFGGDAGLAAYQLVPVSVFGHVPELERGDADPAMARDLLAEAGYADGFEIQLNHTASPLAEKCAVKIAEMLASIGIRVETRAVGMPRIIAAFGGEGRGLTLSFWTYDDGDAGSFLRDCIRTRDPEHQRGLLNASYSDELTDEWIDRALVEIDDQVRRQLYRRVIERALKQVPVVPLFDGVAVYAVRPSVAWTVRVDARIEAASISRSPRG